MNKLTYYFLCLSGLLTLSGCVLGPPGMMPAPSTVDSVPLSPAERQVAGVGGLVVMTPLSVFSGGRQSFAKARAENVRKLRETKTESDSLTQQLNEAKAHNQKLATHCTELLGEVDSLKGKPHATFDQRKDVIDQIKTQMSRMDFAGKQTDQAIKKNKELLASAKSSGGGHEKEMKELQAQIQSLQSEKTALAEKNAKLAQMHKEISTR